MWRNHHERKLYLPFCCFVGEAFLCFFLIGLRCLISFFHKSGIIELRLKLHLKLCIFICIFNTIYNSILPKMSVTTFSIHDEMSRTDGSFMLCKNMQYSSIHLSNYFKTDPHLLIDIKPVIRHTTRAPFYTTHLLIDIKPVIRHTARAPFYTTHPAPVKLALRSWTCHVHTATWKWQNEYQLI